MTVIPVLLLGGFLVYLMTPDERRRALGALAACARGVQRWIAGRLGERDPFGDALRARTRWPVVTWTLALVTAGIFASMLVGRGALGESDTLVRWGGSFGPRTTTGEWWRLWTAMFVHAGPLHLAVNLAGLIAAGVVLERLVGHLAFGGVYLAAGVFASVVSLSAAPAQVSVGASGAVFGVYGLLLATSFWSALHPSPLRMPLRNAARLAPAAAICLAYNVWDGRLPDAAELGGFVVGLGCGLALAQGITVCKPRAHRVAAAVVIVVVLALASTAPLRGLADVRPHIARVVSLEDGTAGLYEEAVTRFRLGRMSAEALAQLIEDTIVPELQTVQARVQAVRKVPREHQALVANADAYLALRSRSWRLRAAALRGSSAGMLRKADEAERASLQAFARVRQAG
jgi:rhomboid protease GluP